MATPANRVRRLEHRSRPVAHAPADQLSPDSPSLDPGAVEQAYRRERARRRARIAHREDARNSNARFWVMLAVLAFLTVIMGLTAFHEIQTSFGLFQ